MSFAKITCLEFRRKFAVSVDKLQLLAPPVFLTHDAAVSTALLLLIVVVVVVAAAADDDDDDVYSAVLLGVPTTGKTSVSFTDGAGVSVKTLHAALASADQASSGSPLFENIRPGRYCMR